MWADRTSYHSVLFPLLFLSSYSQLHFSLQMIFLWTSPLIFPPLIRQRLLVLTRVHEKCLPPWQVGRAVWSAATSGLYGKGVTTGSGLRSSWRTRQAFLPQVINWEATHSGYDGKASISLGPWWPESAYEGSCLGESVASPRPPNRLLSPTRGLCTIWEINFGGVNSMRSGISSVTVAQSSLSWLLYIPSLKLPQPVFCVCVFFIFKPFLNVDYKSLKFIYILDYIEIFP